jgi:alpha-N-arabinofuranosidase
MLKSMNRFILTGVVLSIAAVAHAQGTLTIDADKQVSIVSPKLYGLMTEEINYSYDGGLYAEMVANRTFKKTWNGHEHWTEVTQGSSKLTMEDIKDGPSAALTNSLAVHIDAVSPEERAGVANDGFWGMAVRPSTLYKGSFYAKGSVPEQATVLLIANGTAKVLAKAEIPIAGEDWKQYSFSMKTGPDVSLSAENHLEILFEHPGTVQLQLVSLFPPTYHDRANGNRPDLMKMMAEMHPAFLRLPGGNYLEGDHVKDRFNWKQTIGPLVDRPTHPSPWGYQSSDGMGLLEYLEWCEDLNVEPVLAVYAGYSLSGEQVTGKDLEPFIQDALDEIEYVTGDASTKWGTVRAQNGHSAPFPLHYIEIGNEDFIGKAKATYDVRFSRFSDAIRAKYHDTYKLIATTQTTKGDPDLIDDHYYKSPEGFFEIDKKYDAYDRKGPKIFVGEWATRTGTPTPNFGAALGDAAWMTSMERNSDLIELASYAPLFTNVNPGGMQWATDLIGYTADKAYASPSYWAQVLFAEHLGDHTVESKGEGLNPRFFWSATSSKDRKILYLKLVNASDRDQALSLRLAGVKTGQATINTLHGASRFSTNTIDNPDRIKPVTKTISISEDVFVHTVSANTIEVIDVPMQ